MAHEIRNPLASLSGSIQLLSEELRLDGTRRELMEIVTAEVRRLNALITDFLSYASPRPAQPRETDLVALLGETVTLLRRSRDGAGRVEVATRGHGPFTAVVDPQLMRQVFWNLSLNALEALGEDGVLKATVEGGPGEVVVAFADSGPGIPPEALPKIFTPFFSTKEGGTGLGLAIVFKVVEAHGGRVEVESQVARGTTFRVVLPVHPPAGLSAALGGAA
jgi:two-component system sensor histidine kinase PilS (NtrC family)